MLHASPSGIVLPARSVDSSSLFLYDNGSHAAGKQAWGVVPSQTTIIGSLKIAAAVCWFYTRSGSDDTVTGMSCNRADVLSELNFCS